MSLEGRKIGVIEDDLLMGESLVQSLTLEGANVAWWQTGQEAVNGLKDTAPDVIVCDIRLPDTDGIALFTETAEHSKAPPFIFMTAYGNIDQAVRLMRAGAEDYITKPFEISELVERIDTIAPDRRATKIENTLGVSDAIRRIEQALAAYAHAPKPLLLTGEIGVGKEYCARYLHQRAENRHGPFISVNCAIMPTDVLERELFGVQREQRDNEQPAYLDRAVGGTLFIDGVAQLTSSLQARLLEIIEAQSRTLEGSSSNFPRIICATRRDLDDLVVRGEFREDLRNLLDPTHLHIPALRDRPEDITWHLDQCFREFGSITVSHVKGISSAAEADALQHDWPRNIAELHRRMERAMALALDEWITPIDLFPERGFGSWRGQPNVTSLAEARRVAEHRQIERALALHSGQLAKAAKTLGISRTTLWEKMRRLGLDLDEQST
ncbi:MAG: sigma-54 dependent transcriptional regulator [Pseudomonadota bacterium]